MTAPTCSAITRNGTRCRMPAIVGPTCYIHSAEYIAWHTGWLQQRRLDRMAAPRRPGGERRT